MMNNSYIGVDIGGTSIVAGLLNEGIFSNTVTVSTKAHQPLQTILQQLFNAIDQLIAPGVKAIGIGCPGIIDSGQGVILNINNIPAFKAINLKTIVQEKYNIPVFINNDANCFVLGETFFGAAKGYNHVVGITIGTGLGAGIVINKKVHGGFKGVAGELGCIAYKDSIVEDYCSSKFFTNYYREEGAALFSKAEQADIVAKTAFIELGMHLGWLINTTLYSIAPQIIVIGGSIAKAFKYIEPGIQKQLSQFMFKDFRAKLKIEPAQLDNAGLAGAAALCVSELN